MKRIPTQFQLLNHTITVRVIPADQWLYPDAHAYWDPASLEILLVQQKSSMLWHSFWHECTHAILDMMSSRLSRNEVFVDQFAAHMAQLVASAKYAAKTART